MFTSRRRDKSIRKNEGVRHKEGVEIFCIVSTVLGNMLGLAPEMRANVIMRWIKVSM